MNVHNTCPINIALKWPLATCDVWQRALSLTFYRLYRVERLTVRRRGGRKWALGDAEIQQRLVSER
jgi:hypothetical protein